MAYAISDEDGPDGDHYVRVGDIEAGLQFHFAYSQAKGLRFLNSQTWPGDPPRLGLPTEPPEQVLGQLNSYIRRKRWD